MSAKHLPPGTKRKGGDGRMYVVVVGGDGRLHRWQAVASLLSPQAARVVQTANISGTALVVGLTSATGPGTARVHDGHALWRALPYHRVFLAVASETPQGIFARLFSRNRKDNKQQHGGLLLQTGPQSYTFVGREIYSFKVPPGDEVVKFCWQPPPEGLGLPPGAGAYAVGALGNTYLLDHKTWVANAGLRGEDMNPYEAFHGHDPSTGEALKHQSHRNRVHHRHAATHPLLAYKMLH